MGKKGKAGGKREKAALRPEQGAGLRCGDE